MSDSWRTRGRNSLGRGEGKGHVTAIMINNYFVILASTMPHFVSVTQTTLTHHKNV